ncbi:hypothetical protein RHMOL_Rhmol12G0110200 [Rhododendron molle]|uniref:Uncharacterized protein n=1 Tax=Rhododendron molle TaxID=49168 RepID=A0ACC0LHX2_RHOML|nr:hypothetical protein RHMOL_Rhmol12G0110200 [Rhododendron molle]
MRPPKTIVNLTKNPHHHKADASSTSVMATSLSNSSASSQRDRICKWGEKPMSCTTNAVHYIANPMNH